MTKSNRNYSRRVKPKKTGSINENMKNGHNVNMNRNFITSIVIHLDSCSQKGFRDKCKFDIKVRKLWHPLRRAQEVSIFKRWKITGIGFEKWPYWMKNCWISFRDGELMLEAMALLRFVNSRRDGVRIIFHTKSVKCNFYRCSNI